jgi:tetratricopeptide (TPR) repeat protein
MQGAYEQSLDYSRRALPLYEQVGRKRGKAYVIEGEGQTLLALGRHEEAWARLQDALAIRAEIGDRTHLVEIHAAMIHAALARQNLADAAHHHDALMALLTPADRASLRQQGYFAAFKFFESQGETDRAMHALALALQARDEMAAVLPENDRSRFLRNVPLNRDLAQAAMRYQEDEMVSLGMGKQAKSITWTLRQVQDYLIEDETERRRSVLARLLAQAAAHEITPTHDQLAGGLGVSRRTILRDLAAMQDAELA